MAELRPDSWRMRKLFYSADWPLLCPNSYRNISNNHSVTDILAWIGCFSVMATVHTAKDPERAVHLFAYQHTIVKASQLFDGPAWVHYDAQFHRKMSLSKSWEWGDTDNALYNECFTSRAEVRAHCRVCLSDSHTERACSLVTPTQLGESMSGNFFLGGDHRGLQSRG